MKTIHKWLKNNDETHINSANVDILNLLNTYHKSQLQTNVNLKPRFAPQILKMELKANKLTKIHF